MGPWGIGRADPRTADLTWNWEDIELAPDWVQDEILLGPQGLEEWLKDQKPSAVGDGAAKQVQRRRRGRPPKR